MHYVINTFRTDCSSNLNLNCQLNTQLMFSHSQSQTPIPAGNYHEKLAETVTWVKDWYVPVLLSNNENNMANSMRLMGWFKTNMSHKQVTDLTINDNDVLDLNQFPYQQSETVAEKVETGEDTTLGLDKLELHNALSLDKDEGQILGLG